MPDPNQQQQTPEQKAQTEVNKSGFQTGPEVNSGASFTEHQNTRAKEVVDHLAQPGALEVAEMPESAELEARRQATHDSLNESVSGIEAGAAFDEEDGGLAALFKEANLSKRHLRFCCSGILIVVLLIILFFGVRAGITWFQENADQLGNDEEQEEVIDDEDQTEDLDSEENKNNDEDELPEVSEYLFLEPDILSGVLIGGDKAEEDPATTSGELIGESQFTASGLTAMIQDLESMVNVLSIDVNELLDDSTDRRDAYEDYLNSMNFLNAQALDHIETLESENADIADEFELAELRRDEHELRFFEQLNSFDAFAAESSLTKFIIEAERVVELRSQFLAREKLIDYFNSVTEAFEGRIRDVELNEEALIKGVQVVEVDGSDLDLILDESEL